MNQCGLYLRSVQPEDIDLLFKWANDGAVRANGFHTDQIPYEEHRRWFDKMLKDACQIQYILMSGDDAVGQIRLTVEDHCAEVHYSIASEKRNKGYGKTVIQLVQNEVYSKYPNIQKLIAKVKPTNMASIRCFERNGFSKSCIQYELNKENFQVAKASGQLGGNKGGGIAA